MIRVLFEDDSLVFVDKPAGIVVQRRLHAPDEPFLLGLVERQVGPVSLLQRLDRGTSGVLFFSKRPELNARLTRQFERRRIRKRYLAIVEGAIPGARTIDLPLARIGAIQFGVREGGKRALTHLEPIEVGPAGSLVALRLETGRTHQIRVHLSATGHPLAGDWLYGERNAERPMLHAAELELTHPLTQQPLRVAAPVPPDFVAEAKRRGLHAPNRGPGPDAGAPLLVHASAALRSTVRHSSGESDGSMKQLLAVDDEETVLRVIALSLGKVGEVTTAADGREAIALMKGGRHFDCVVLDLDMPNVGGSEVVTWMKGQEQHRDTPVVLLTAFESADLEQELIAKGASAYLTKPVDPDKLAQLVGSLA